MIFLLACGEASLGAVELGVVSADGETATALSAAAYGYDAETDGGHQMMLIISPVINVTCEQVAAWFQTDIGKDDYEPAAVLDPGTCMTSITASGYDPAGTSVRSTEEDPDFDLFTNVYCAMEGGAWVQEDDEWTYDGEIWSGSALQNTSSVSGGDGDDFVWDIDADGWDGGFPYDSSRLDVPASGAVVGSGGATWCSDLSAIPSFGS